MALQVAHFDGLAIRIDVDNPLEYVNQTGTACGVPPGPTVQKVARGCRPLKASISDALAGM